MKTPHIEVFDVLKIYLFIYFNYFSLLGNWSDWKKNENFNTILRMVFQKLQKISVFRVS